MPILQQIFKLVDMFILITYSFHRPIMQKRKALKTLRIMLARLFVKAKERAKAKVKMQKQKKKIF